MALPTAQQVLSSFTPYTATVPATGTTPAQTLTIPATTSASTVNPPTVSAPTMPTVTPTVGGFDITSAGTAAAPATTQQFIMDNAGLYNQARQEMFTPQYFASTPDGNQVYQDAVNLRTSAPEIASLYSQATGQNLGETLANVNAYLAQTGQTLPSTTASFNIPSYTATAPGATFNAPSLTPKYWGQGITTAPGFESPEAIQSMVELSNRGAISGSQIADMLIRSGLSPEQGAYLWAEQGGGATGLDVAQNRADALANIQDYLTQTGRSTTGFAGPSASQRYAQSLAGQTVGGEGYLSTVKPELSGTASDAMGEYVRQFETGQITPQQLVADAAAQNLTVDQLAQQWATITGEDPAVHRQAIIDYFAANPNVTPLEGYVAPTTTTTTTTPTTTTPSSSGFGDLNALYTQAKQQQFSPEYFATVADGNQIYADAARLGVSANELANLYSQATGADAGETLANINAYLGETEKTLPQYAAGGAVNSDPMMDFIRRQDPAAQRAGVTPKQVQKAQDFLAFAQSKRFGI